MEHFASDDASKSRTTAEQSGQKAAEPSKKKKAAEPSKKKKAAESKQKKPRRQKKTRKPPVLPSDSIPSLESILKENAEMSKIADSEKSLGGHSVGGNHGDDSDENFSDDDDDVECGPTNSTMIGSSGSSKTDPIPIPKGIPLCKTDFFEKHKYKTQNRDGVREWNPQQELYKIPIKFHFKKKINEDFFEVVPAKKTVSVFYYKKFDRENYEGKRRSMLERTSFPLEKLGPFKKRLQKDPYAFVAVPISSKIDDRLRRAFPNTPAFLELIQWRPTDNSTGAEDFDFKDEFSHEWFDINEKLDFSPETGILNFFI